VYINTVIQLELSSHCNLSL